MNDSKSLPIRDTQTAIFSQEDINNRKVTKYTRAGKNGKAILCPVCKSMSIVYRFNFSGLTCPECKQSSGKYEWEVL